MGGVRVRFGRIRTEIDLRPFLAEERMVRFQDELVRSGVRRGEAAELTESLLAVLIEGWGEGYADAMEANLHEMAQIRQELRSKYDVIRDAFAPGRPPAELPPGFAESFRNLFERLQRLMDEVESPEDYLHDVDANDLMRALESRGEEPTHEVAPDERLLNPIPGEEPPPAPSTGFPTRTPAVARQVRAAAEDFVARHFQRARLRRVVPSPTSGAAAAAEYARLSGVDPVFAGRGYQLEIEWGGERFQPDAIEQRPEGFRLYDNKEVFASTEESAYSDPEVQRELRSRMEKYASLARSAEPEGCLGWTFTTRSEFLADLMRGFIEDIRNSPEGADLARFLTVDGPGGR